MSTDTGTEYLDLGPDHPNAIGFKVTGKFTGAGMVDLIGRIEEVTSRGEKARLFVDMTDYAGWEIEVAKEKFEHMSTLWNGIGRVAYVVDNLWMANWIGLVDAVTPMHIRAFTADQADEAREWLLAGD